MLHTNAFARFYPMTALQRSVTMPDYDLSQRLDRAATSYGPILREAWRKSRHDNHQGTLEICPLLSCLSELLLFRWRCF